MRITRIIAITLLGVLLIPGACASPAAVTPAAPVPVAATPVAPVPVATTPAAPAPVAATPVAPAPVAATPVAPATPTTAQGANEAWVNVPGNEFRPSILTVLVGTKVNWISTDGEPNTIFHTVTSTTGLFKGIVTHGGGTFGYTFTERGTFNYYCENVAGMTGTVIVR